MTASLTAAYSNHFRVKDVEQFLRHAQQFTGATIEIIDPDNKAIRMSCETPWLIYRSDEQGNLEHEPIDLGELVGTHLIEGEVAVFTWASAERFSILGGVIGVNSEGETFAQTLTGLEAHATAVLGQPDEGSALDVINRNT